jgi:hypothetical protein
MYDLILAIGLVLAIEGTLYAAFPGLMRQALKAMLEVEPNTLRLAGVASLATGVLIVWLVR